MPELVTQALYCDQYEQEYGGVLETSWHTLQLLVEQTASALGRRSVSVASVRQGTTTSKDDGINGNTTLL